MKLKLRALSVQIKGVIHRKEEGIIFDTEGRHKSIKSELLAEKEAGFLEEVKSEPKKAEKKGNNK